MRTGSLGWLLVEPSPRSTAPSPEKVTALPLRPGECRAAVARSPSLASWLSSMHAARNQHCSHLEVNGSVAG